MPQAKNRHQLVITALLVYTMEKIRRLTHLRVFYEDKCHLTFKVSGTPTVACNNYLHNNNNGLLTVYPPSGSSPVKNYNILQK